MVSTQSRLLHGLALVLASLALLVGSAAQAAAGLETGFAIHGQVATIDHQPLAGVTIAFSGGLAAQVTDAEGRYEVSAPVGRYTVTPRKDGYVFHPAFATAVISAGDVEANFTAAAHPVAMPRFGPGPGTYTGSVRVSISCETAGATIRYTTDGHEVTTTSAVYAGPLTFSATTVLRARAFKEGRPHSPMATATYTLRPHAVAAPAFDPRPGTYTGSVRVHISCATEGATIRCTTDGSEVSATSPAYGGAIALTRSTVIKARAYKEGMHPSPMVVGHYVIRPLEHVATPAFDPKPGAFGAAVTVAITCATEGATIRFTVDGREVTDQSPLYEAPLTFTHTTYLKARAFKEGILPSHQAQGVYRIEAPRPVAHPVFAPRPGTYAEPVDLTLTCATEGATIRYTTDGTEVTATSPIYEAPIALSTRTVVKARAYKEGVTPSLMVVGLYVIGTQQMVAVPRFRPAPGAFTTATLQVTLSCATEGATIRYTTDGTEVTGHSPAYQEPLSLERTTTIKVRAYKEGMLPSHMVTGTYTKHQQ